MQLSALLFYSKSSHRPCVSACCGRVTVKPHLQQSVVGQNRPQVVSSQTDGSRKQGGSQILDFECQTKELGINLYSL